MNINRLFQQNNNLILQEIKKYDDEKILTMDVEHIASTIANKCMIDSNLELITDDLRPKVYLKDISTYSLPAEMRICATKKSYPFAAVDYHIGAKGNISLLQHLPIMNHQNVSLNNDNIVLTITLNYASKDLPDDKIIEVKQQYNAWLQEANTQIKSQTESIQEYNNSLKPQIESQFKQIKDKWQRIKRQRDKLNPNI